MYGRGSTDGVNRRDGDAIEERITAALERLSMAQQVVLREAAGRHGLSPIQAQTLVHLRRSRPELARVSRLANEFGVTNATVSDAVSSLAAKGLVRKERASDGRVATLVLTPAGSDVASELAAWPAVLSAAVRSLPAASSEPLLASLMALIESLQQAGVITVARMCTTCRFFERDRYDDPVAPHRCALLKRKLAPGSLRVDCPEHEPAVGATRQTQPARYS